MSRKKRRNRANKRTKRQYFDWPWARKRGAIIPDYFPSCPDCETNQFVDGPDINTGIFHCGQCSARIVVVVEDGEDLSVHLGDLEQFTGTPVDIQQWSGDVLVGTTKYRPTELEETTDDGGLWG